MRALTSYILAALMIGLALDFVAPSVFPVGLSSNVWPSAEGSASAGLQIVNRAAKANRLQVSAKNHSTQTKTVRDVTPSIMPAARKVPDGCDPAFSPLSASASLNYAAKCVAEYSIQRVTNA